MNIVNTALVGIGGFGRIHLAGIRKCEEMGLMKLTAVCIRSQEKYAIQIADLIKADTKIYSTYEEMLVREKGRTDLIALPTGIDAHEEQSVAALRNGYHVLCEKPAAGTIEECLNMQKAKNESGRILSIGYQNIYSPVIQKIKKLTMEKRLGKLISAKTRVLWPRDSEYYTRNKWAARIKCGEKYVFDSPIMNAAAHFLNNTLYVAGNSLTSSATPLQIYGENYKAKKIEYADTQFLRIVTDTDVKIQLVATHACMENIEPLTEYIYEKGRIIWTSENKGKTIVLENTRGKEIEIDSFDNGDSNIHDLVFIGTARHLIEGIPLFCDIDNSYQHIICVNKSYESSGGSVKIPEEFCIKSFSGDKNSEISLTSIKDISSIIQRCHNEEKSFYELAVPWAEESRSVEYKI